MNDDDPKGCPHCAIMMIVQIMLRNGADPEEVTHLVMEGLKDGMEGTAHMEISMVHDETVH